MLVFAAVLGALCHNSTIKNLIEHDRQRPQMLYLPFRNFRLAFKRAFNRIMRDRDQRDNCNINQFLAAILETDCNAISNNRLHLAKAPGRFRRVPNKVTGDEITGHSKGMPDRRMSVVCPWIVARHDQKRI